VFRVYVGSPARPCSRAMNMAKGIQYSFHYKQLKLEAQMTI